MKEDFVCCARLLHNDLYTLCDRAGGSLCSKALLMSKHGIVHVSSLGALQAVLISSTQESCLQLQV